MKTVVVVWKQRLVQPTTRRENMSFWGIGDLLRGVCGMFEACREMGYTMYVDMRHHPLGRLFKPIPHAHEAAVDSIKDSLSCNTFESNNAIKRFLSDKLRRSDLWCGFVWAGLYIFQKPLSEECKAFVRSILVPTDEYAAYIDAHLPTSEYNITHFRLGDATINSSSVTIPPSVLRLLEDSPSGTNILISDSDVLRKTALELHPAKYIALDTHTCHVGIETDIEKVKSTIVEFIAASRAKSINTFSVYSWISGFVNTVHMIYDVPLTAMKAR
jgi:hypothetical protein